MLTLDIQMMFHLYLVCNNNFIDELETVPLHDSDSGFCLLLFFCMLFESCLGIYACFCLLFSSFFVCGGSFAIVILWLIDLISPSYQKFLGFFIFYVSVISSVPITTMFSVLNFSFIKEVYLSMFSLCEVLLLVFNSEYITVYK